ncbi:ribonuclease P protein component [[Mycobacterium] holstebronense]|uniref:Ribonuclease P protein component n=1 Tax=[Mycobacterium] holstebronense TaxID=3064288 RepID=A0ABN9NUV7_9MYCO|nr:ribonuclease P protein component [Mycolicibacter sp. MU0102]CAJ1510947.1 ribonuclease P protein component [Mycolicibacter sp. MU0102]
MLPAQYRMRRSADFGATVKHGRKAVQPDVILYDRVIYDRRTDPSEESAVAAAPPRVGLIIAKSVGNAVDRHRVARRLRHVAREVLADLEPQEQLVIRALPGSSGATSDELANQLRTGLRSIRRAAGAVR